MTINNKREIWITRFCLALTLICLIGLFGFLMQRTGMAYSTGDTRSLIDIAIFSFAMFFMAYGTVLYQVCLLCYYKRRLAYEPAPREALEAVYEGSAPTLSIIVPSYKEERGVIWQTLLSAALTEYPQKNVTLLIDDPYRPRVLEDIVKIEDTRTIPAALQALFDVPAKRFADEKEAFAARLAQGDVNHEIELNRLSLLYDEVSAWLAARAGEICAGKPVAALSHSDRFFVENILLAPARRHEALADELRSKMSLGETPDATTLARQYARLAGLFNVRFASFERKKYANLSHESNKAMNLNSYIGLMGKSWKEVETRSGELKLQIAQADAADFSVPSPDYVITLDADSVVLGDYALRLINIMEKPENTKLAVIQSPVSSFPDCPGGLERAASASIDVQFPLHQGYTHWNATFWVGASAMLRTRALLDIEEIREENGNPVAVYIQDRTVIEDTESTIDLVHRGWQLYNYPERMTFSASPPDFGSLLIQRRRWANGGLIILPKLMQYAVRAPKSLGLLKELFMRFHYLASTTTLCASMFLCLFYPFGDVSGTVWFPLSILPFMALYIRALRNMGYTVVDALRISALNLMLIPVLTGGVLKQFQQMITRRKIPFSRTPKVSNRTVAPALYCLIALVLPEACAASTILDIQQHQWVKALLSSINVGLLTYALVSFIGLRAACEDMLLGVRTRWREAFHHAEIIPLYASRWIAESLPEDRKSA